MRVFLSLISVITLLALGSCGSITSQDVTVLAGSELKDIEPLLPAIESATGVRLKFSYVGSLDGAEKVIGGDPSDMAWFSHAAYLSLLEGAATKIKAQEKIMLSPVILGVKESAARAWGWTAKDPSWREIADKAKTGELRFGMTNPAASNSGFTALVAVTTAFSNKGDALTEADVANTAITDFFRGQNLTAGSSGWLADEFVKRQDSLNGIVNYESVIMQLNGGGQLKEKLALIYPSDGVISADYPLMLLNSSKREAFQKVVDFLRSPDTQSKIMAETSRRPITPQVKPDGRFGNRLLVELPFPARQSIVDAILFSYMDEHRKPAHVYYVLDVSGSMYGERLTKLRAAFDNLSGRDTTLTGQFARFSKREKITAIPFSTGAYQASDFEITRTGGEGGLSQLRDYIANLNAGGNTAIYSAMQKAYELAASAKGNEKDRLYSIVLMTDGENNSGISAADFKRFFQMLPPEAREIKTFPILFGEGTQTEMNMLASVTGGRVFDGTKSLSAAFKAIRGYQ